MTTRRRFLASLPLLAPAFSAAAQSLALPKLHHKKPTGPPPPLTVFFGTDTTKGVSKGIYRATFDPVHGVLSTPILAIETPRPGFLAVSRPSNSRRFLYSVTGHGNDTGAITSFSIDPTGGLRQIGQTPSGGANPAYVSIDDTDRVVFAANYTGGTVASFKVQPDGSLSSVVDRFDFNDIKEFGHLGPVADRQDHSHPHCATISPDNRFLLVCDLGTSEISVFLIHPDTGHLTNHKLFTNNRPGSGPRHIVFHPNGRWVYTINEIDSTLDRYLWSTTQFSETPQGMLVNDNDPIKTTAESYTGKNTAAELAISPDGNYLYASNRGEDSLVVYTIGPREGVLKFMQRIPCGGKTPRHFTLDPTGQWLLCGNQDSATITIFRRDQMTGKLTGPLQTAPIDSPMYTLFA